MSSPIKSKRPPPSYVRDALAVVAESDTAHMSLQHFRMHMDRRGWSADETSRAVMSIERRGWIAVGGGSFRITASGQAAVSTGEGVVAPKKSVSRMKHRVKQTRMPGGLF